MSIRGFSHFMPSRLLVAVLYLMMLSVIVRAENLFEGAPPAPPGYKHYREAQLAVLLGRVPVIDVAPEVPDGIIVQRDLSYTFYDGEPQKLDLFIPRNTVVAPPILLFIHGGGWRKGKKEDYAFYNVEFAKLGYATASMQYRLAPKHHFPAAVQDVKAAINWLQTHGADYGYDGNRMALIGGSAGGHLALLAGYSQDPAWEVVDRPQSLPNPVRGVINFYGVADCTTQHAKEASEVQDFIGRPFAEAPELYVQCSPLQHLDRGDPPTLTFHGTIDELVPVSQADRLHQQLTELGIPNYLDRVEGWPHTMDLARPINDRCRHIMARFLQHYLPLDPDAAQRE